MEARDMTQDESTLDADDLTEVSSVLGALSVFPFLLLVGLTLHVRKWRPFLAVIGYVSSGVCLLGIAGLFQFNLSGLEHALGTLWVGANAIATFGLARMVSNFDKDS